MFLRMAWRNIWRNPRRTGIVISAVAIGIGSCLFSMSLSYGVAQEMVKTAIEGEIGHLQIHARGYAESRDLAVRMPDGGRVARAALDLQPGVEAFAARVRGQGLLNSPRASAGVRVLGIDPVGEARVTSLANSLVAGQWIDAAPSQVLIGERLARRLQVGVGKKLVLSVQDLSGELTGKAFRVGGIVDMASSELNSGVVFVALDQAQALFGLGDGVTEIAVVTTAGQDLNRLKEALSEQLGPGADVRTWSEIQPLLEYLVEITDQNAYVMYGAVFVAMGFGIANVLFMCVFERAREIGVMMAMGMRRRRVVALVVGEACLLTLFGLAVGIAGAVAAVWGLRDGIDFSAFAAGLEALGARSRVAPVLRASDLVVPIAVGGVAALLASAWPAWRAASGRPANLLRGL
jgi:ABC-type lipoprotein release transport system permease subunit